MRLLLDTHVMLWWGEGAGLRPPTIALIEAAEQVLVSSVTGWEVAIKSSLGKLRTGRTVSQAIEASGFVELPVYLRHAEGVATLPWHHRDPFDRLLVAQALQERLTLVTRDRIFERYELPVILA
jgi:PIN domain nuclease of toxin-antitoxin system